MTIMELINCISIITACVFSISTMVIENHKIKKNIIELQCENKQLKDNWNKVKNIIEDERMSHWAPGPLFLTELLISMEKTEKGDSDE